MSMFDRLHKSRVPSACVRLQALLHYEIWEYYQSTTKVQA